MSRARPQITADSISASLRRWALNNGWEFSNADIAAATGAILSPLPADFSGPVCSLSPADQLRLPAVFAAHTQRDHDCLVWTGQKDSKGYGRVRAGGANRRPGAHRVAWILAHGPIADPRLVIDHLCRNHSCVLVEHLELVTNAENTVRGNLKRLPKQPSAVASNYVHARAVKDRCLNGHPLAGPDADVRLYLNPRTGYLSRHCRPCQRLRAA